MTPSSQAYGQPITEDQAIEIAIRTIGELSGPHDFVLLRERTVTRPFGWVFFYATRRFVETGERQYLVPGTAPLVVLREDGSTEHLATSMPPARAIDIYEERWRRKFAAGQGAAGN